MNYSGQYIELLERSRLFFGIGKDDINEMLVCLDARHKKYLKGETIVWEGDEVNEIGVVLSGHGRSITDNPSGKSFIVTLLEEGSFVGVLLAASRERKSPVSVQASDDMVVIFFPFDKILGHCSASCLRHNILLRNLVDGIACMALELHDRNNCLTQPGVREKILAYLNIESKKKESRTFTIPLDRSSMAEYLNIDRSALSRELSRMKTDGLIDYYKNSFRLL